MHPIFVDLRAALRDVEEEAARLLEQARRRFAEGAVRTEDPVERWAYTGAMAAGVEKIYSGIERALTTVARELDRHVPQDRDWHSILLRRMTMEVPDRRPPVISAETYRVLNQLRAFRHRVRNSYGRGLDLGLVIANAEKMPAAIAALSADIERLRKHLEASDAADRAGDRAG